MSNAIISKDVNIFLLGAAVIGIIIFHDHSAAQEQVDDPILHRQLAMQQLERNADTLGEILAGTESKDKLVETVNALARDAKEIRASFQSKKPGGRTKPEAWANWQDFGKRLDDMVTKTASMAETAKTGDVSVVAELAADAIPCRSCHTVYRAPKS